MSRPIQHLLGPVPCIGCRRLVSWFLVDGMYRLWTPSGVAHRCKAKYICGATMQGGEFCGRRRGHRYGHRTRYALDNNARAKRAAA